MTFGKGLGFLGEIPRPKVIQKCLKLGLIPAAHGLALLKTPLLAQSLHEQMKQIRLFCEGVNSFVVWHRRLIIRQREVF